ncbi:NAD(P)H-hydrate dehydratase [Leifsonia sp. H3M29-4]|uniref:ADP-dependent NAD(P)H-hydrate dehydratase n=1 Tax=Salinibacterium metalliresistens TaxID=3031321 RepID=UPI0023DCCEF2|nr:ADP/ATP-dependent (S)-NAD(P)H-hydrate dehydratase [Salinibacterium metalliresistens]MDF1479663.1 NAD(P)H-hydrate dehydratase [Salinibacterium metalliresistens]
MATPTEWTADAAAAVIRVPAVDDDKYRRGVLGVVTGSDLYPGAAVLGVEAALRTGVGMVRYLGPERATDLVLQRRPEAVATRGRVQAWLLGSGMDPVDRDPAAMLEALAEGLPSVLDGGGLDLYDHARAPVVLTPHARELARVLKADVADVLAEPAEWARIAADDLGVTVLLKGNTTYVAGPGVLYSVRSAPTWLATAGAGDALGGILGALVATNADAIAADPAQLARVAASAALIHGLAAQRASGGGPLTVLDLCAAVPETIAGLLRARD